MNDEDEQPSRATIDTHEPPGGVTKTFTFRDRAVYVEPADALVLSDLHVGRAEASDVEFPLGERAHLVDRLEVLLETFSPTTVVFAGDVLHSFGYVPLVARRTVDALVDTVADADARLVGTPGNHDPQLEAILDAPLEDVVVLDGDDSSIAVSHGHVPPAADADWYVVGHEHPALEVHGQKHAAYLHADGAYRGGDVLVLPAFTELARGVKINRMRAADFDAAILADASAIRPMVRDDATGESLWFPALDDIRRHL